MIYNELFWYVIIGIITALFIWKKFCNKKKSTKKHIFEFCSQLKEELNIFEKQETEIYFYLFKRNINADNVKFLKCDWINSKISIKYEENNPIKILYNNNNLNNFEFYHKITLIYDKKEIDFYIHILNHQKNIYNLFIDNQNEKVYSLEEVFYSKNRKKFKRINKISNDIMNNKLQFEDYKSEYFMRGNYLNIIKKDLEEKAFKLEIDLNEEILKKKNTNLFLNVLFGNKKKPNVYLFLNDDDYDFKIKEGDHEFINSFYDKFIKSKFYISCETNPDNYFNKMFTYLERIYVNESEDIEENNINREQTDSNNNDIFKQLEKEFKDKLTKYINFFHNKCLFYLSYLFTIKNRIKDEHVKLCEKICLIFLSTHTSPYYIIEDFYLLKKRFFNNNNLTSYDKLKILVSLKTFLYFKGSKDLNLYEYNKLENTSPFIQGYLFYKQIIEELKINSLLTFVYNQFISGSGFDYISKHDCYKLKYIPLCIIKSHLLFNNYENKYFFTYSNEDNIHAFTEGYSKDIFFNLSTLEYPQSKVYYSQNLEKDTSKIGLLYLHENSHIIFRTEKSFNINSRRGVIQSDFNLYLNNYVVNRNKKGKILLVNKSGESGKALEYLLFNDNNAINQLMECQKIEKLKNVNLFIQDNNKDLVKIKRDIAKDKKFEYITHNFKNLEYKQSESGKQIEAFEEEKNIYDSMILSV